METNALLSSIDSEISRLQQVRALLAGDATIRTVKGVRKKRTLSAEARARIGAATKARWAAGKMGKQSRNRLKKLGAKKAA